MADVVEDAMLYLRENDLANIKFYKGNAFLVEAPNFVNSESNSRPSRESRAIRQTNATKGGHRSKPEQSFRFRSLSKKERLFRSIPEQGNIFPEQNKKRHGAFRKCPVF